MTKYYVIEESYTIEDYYVAYEIMEDVLFETIDSAKEYLHNSLMSQRNGKWEINEYNNLYYYRVELYESLCEDSEEMYWVEYTFYIRELTLL